MYCEVKYFFADVCLTLQVVFEPEVVEWDVCNYATAAGRCESKLDVSFQCIQLLFKCQS